MKFLTQHIQGENYSNLFLYGAIMFANIDYRGILDYGIKAVIGAGVWFGFKIAQDYVSVRIRDKARQHLKDAQKDLKDHSGNKPNLN